MPFELDYAGDPGLSGITQLRLERDETRFHGRFRVFDVVGWIDAREQGSPLPPMDGSVSTPRVEVAGAQLEGVEIVLDEPTIADKGEASGTAGPTP